MELSNRQAAAELPPAVRQALAEADAAITRAYSKLGDLWQECADHDINVAGIDEIATAVLAQKKALGSLKETGLKPWSPDEQMVKRREEPAD